MNRFLKTTVLALMACGLSTPAWATLTVQYGLSTPLPAGDPLAIPGGTTCVDGGACDGQAGVANLMSINVGGLGTLTLAGAGSTSGAPGGNITFTLTGQVSGITTLYFAISDVGFTSPATPLQLLNSVGGTQLGGTVAGNLTSQGWMDDGNQLFGTTPGGTTTVAATTIGAAQGNGSSGSVGTASPYSMTLLVVVDLTSASNGSTFQVNGNLSAVPVPEPGSMFLLGGALLVTGKLVRKKLAKA